MKKLFAVSLLLAILSAAVFAQVKEGITIGAWGQAIVAPVVATLDNDDAKKEADVYAGVGSNVQSTGPRIRVDINAADPDNKYGFTLRISTNDLASFSVQNYARVWVSPIPQLRIDAGKFRDETLMGKVVDNDSYNYVLAMKDGNSIFDRFDTSAGALLTLKPVTGLFIGAKADLGILPQLAGGTLPAANAETVYEKSQIAVGYTIPDVGLVRAQFVGNKSSFSAGTTNTIQAAFAYTGTEDLTVDVGFKYPVLLTEDENTDQNPLHAALGVKFKAGDFDITGRVDADFAGSKTVEAAGVKTTTSDAPEINIHLLPRYNIGFATLGVELGAIITGDKVVDTAGTKATTKGGVSFGAGLWLFKSWGKGTAQAGVTFQPNGERPENTYSQGFIAVPLIFTYTF